MSLDKSSFTSYWDYCQSKSSYDFNSSLKDLPGQWLSVGGRFEGDLSTDINTIMGNTQSVTLRTRRGDSVSDTISMEEQDLIDAGVDPTTWIVTDKYAGSLADLPTVSKMVDTFGMSDVDAKIHVQHPGQGWFAHVDDLEQYDDPAQVKRFMVELADWKPGQISVYGSYLNQQWKAGEIHWSEWSEIPHTNVNMGYEPRITLMVTGVISGTTQEFLKNCNTKSRYKV